MHGKKILVLALLAAALAGLYFFQKKDQARGPDAYDRALFEGVDPSRLVELRIENLERSSIVKLERDQRGVWSITDPLAYPSDPGVVNLLIDLVRSHRAQPVAIEDPAAAGLDPPTAIVEATERFADGREVTTRVEVGDVDADPRWVFVRTGGEVMLALRTLLTTVDRGATDYRQRKVLSVRPQDVVALRRSGSFPRSDPGPADGGPGAEPVPVPLEVDAETAPYVMTSPFRAQLDMQAIGAVLLQATGMEVKRFVSDSAEDLAPFGLDPAPMRLELLTRGGDSLALLFGSLPADAGAPAPERRWVCALEGRPHVWQVAFDDLRVLATAPEDLLDYRLVRILRNQVETVVIQDGERRIDLGRPGPHWMVSEQHGEGERLRARADPQRVDDLLTLLGNFEIGAFLPEVPFPEDQVRGAIAVRDELQRAQGGELGPTHVTDEGIEGVLYRRHGDAVTALLDPALLAVLDESLATLRSREVVVLEELDLVRIHLTGPAGGERSWVRGETGRWSREGYQIEDRAFAPHVDRLIAVRAERWLEQAERAPLQQPVEVRVTRKSGAEETYRLGLVGAAPELREEVEYGGQRAAVRFPGRHALLLQLLE